jgi:predicted TIM-barrel fold metal-dependent hydrolase
MICEGVFEMFPSLKLVIVEGGIGWLSPLLWRLEKNWKGLRTEVPWVKRSPIEIAAEHIRLTTQPLDEPSDKKHLRQIVDMLPSDEMLLFSSDYPHWDFDNPDKVFREFPEVFRRKVFYENASKLYNL